MVVSWITTVQLTAHAPSADSVAAFKSLQIKILSFVDCRYIQNFKTSSCNWYPCIFTKKQTLKENTKNINNDHVDTYLFVAMLLPHLMYGVTPRSFCIKIIIITNKHQWTVQTCQKSYLKLATEIINTTTDYLGRGVINGDWQLPVIASSYSEASWLVT